MKKIMLLFVVFFSLCLTQVWGQAKPVASRVVKENKRVLKEISKNLRGEKISSTLEVQNYYQGLLGKNWEAKLEVLMNNQRYMQHLRHNSGHKLDEKVVYILSLLPRLSVEQKNSKAILNVFNLYITGPKMFRESSKFNEFVEHFKKELSEMENKKELESQDLNLAFERAVAKTKDLDMKKILEMCRV